MINLLIFDGFKLVETKKQPARAADGDSHLVVAAKAVELVELIGRVAGARSHLSGEKKSWKTFEHKSIKVVGKVSNTKPGCGCEFFLASSAREVVRVVNLASESQRVTI